MYSHSASAFTHATTQPPAGVDGLARPKRPLSVLLLASDHETETSCRRQLTQAGVQCVVSTANVEHAFALLGHERLFDALVIGANPQEAGRAKILECLRQRPLNIPAMLVAPRRD